VAETDCLEGVQADDALEGEEFQHHLVRLELRLLEAVEAQAGYHREGGGGYLDHGEPDVCEMHVVAGAAVGACSQAGGGRDPEDDADGEVLQDEIPGSL